MKQLNEATKVVAKKAQEKFWGFNGIQTHDRHDTGAVFYQLSYEASLEAGQEWVQLIPIYTKNWIYTKDCLNQDNLVMFGNEKLISPVQ